MRDLMMSMISMQYCSDLFRLCEPLPVPSNSIASPTCVGEQKAPLDPLKATYLIKSDG